MHPEESIRRAEKLLENSVSQVTSTHHDGAHGDELPVARAFRAKIIEVDPNPGYCEAQMINVTQRARELGIVADALWYLEAMGVALYSNVGKHPLENEKRWMAGHPLPEEYSDLDEAQASTALLSAFRPIFGNDFFVNSYSTIGKRSEVALAYFRKKLAGFIHKVHGEKYGYSEADVIRTLVHIAEDMENPAVQGYIQEMKDTTILLTEALLGKGKTFGAGSSKPSLPATITPFEKSKDKHELGWNLAQALWIKEVEAFWNEGIGDVRIDLIVSQDSNVLDMKKIPEYQEHSIKQQIASNLMFLLVDYEHKPQAQILKKIAFYLLTKPESELEEIKKKLSYYCEIQ